MRLYRLLGTSLALCFASLSAAATTFTVINTNDSGAGSLRQAILDANGSMGADTIAFAIPGAGVHTITPATPLPTITGPVTLNGYTQSGASPNTLAVGDDAVLLIELSGLTSGGTGIAITGGGSTVRGLVIHNFGPAMTMNTAGGNTVAGNFIGTDPTGMIAMGNGGFGVVSITGVTNNVIGGPSAADRNLISGNAGSFTVFISGASASGNLVQGNYIGTDASGTAALGNSVGVGIWNGSNTVGGLAADGPAEDVERALCALADAPQRRAGGDVHLLHPLREDTESVDICLGEPRRLAKAEDLLDPASNEFLPAKELRQRFDRVGAFDKRVITYCGGGAAASADAMTLVMLGHPDVMGQAPSLGGMKPAAQARGVLQLRLAIAAYGVQLVQAAV